MIYSVVGLKNAFTGFEPQLMVFHNHEEAYATLRRNMRDLVIAEDLNQDKLNDMEFFVLGDYDSETGRFDNYEKPVLMNVESMVWDLLSEDDSNIHVIGGNEDD